MLTTRIKLIFACILIFCSMATFVNAEMDFTLEELKAIPDYQNAAPDRQQRVEARYVKDAWTERKRETIFSLSTDEEKLAIIEAFNSKYPMGVEFTKPEILSIEEPVVSG